MKANAITKVFLHNFFFYSLITNIKRRLQVKLLKVKDKKKKVCNVNLCHQPPPIFLSLFSKSPDLEYAQIDQRCLFGIETHRTWVNICGFQVAKEEKNAKQKNIFLEMGKKKNYENFLNLFVTLSDSSQFFNARLRNRVLLLRQI